MGTMAMIRRVENPLMLAVKEEKVLKVRLMIAKGADVNEIDKSYYSRTALHIAVETNNLKIANMLLNAGANVNVQDYYKLTPLMTVKGNTSGEILRLLVQHGADVNNKNLNGRTALFEAVQYDNFEAVKALLEVGADATIKDDFGNSVLIYARSESIKKILIIYGAEQKEETK